MSVISFDTILTVSRGGGGDGVFLTLTLAHPTHTPVRCGHIAGGGGRARHFPQRPGKPWSPQTLPQGRGIPLPSPCFPRAGGHRCQTSPRRNSPLTPGFHRPPAPSILPRPPPLAAPSPHPTLQPGPGLTPHSDPCKPQLHPGALPRPPRPRQAAASPSAPAAAPEPPRNRARQSLPQRLLRTYCSPERTTTRTPEERLLPAPDPAAAQRSPPRPGTAPAPPQAPHLHRRHDGSSSSSSPSRMRRRPRPTQTQRRAPGLAPPRPAPSSPVTCPRR